MLNQKQSSTAHNVLIGTMCSAVSLLPTAFEGMATYYHSGMIPDTSAFVHVVVFWICVVLAAYSSVLLRDSTRNKEQLVDEIRSRNLKAVE